MNALDVALGRVRSVLEDLAIADRTLVLFTSDHGCHFRTRNREYKRSCHEASIRVPMVACGPGFAGGQVRPELVSLVDVPATVLAAAGLAVPGHFRGRPLQALAAGTAGDWRREVFVQISEHEMGRAIRTDRWKYAVRAPGKEGWECPTTQTYRESHLYDLDADCHERDNLVADPAFQAVRDELGARAADYIRRIEHTAATIHPAEAG